MQVTAPPLPVQPPLPVEPPPPDALATPANATSQASAAITSAYSAMVGSASNYGMRYGSRIMTSHGLNNMINFTGVPPPQMAGSTAQNMYNYHTGYGYDQSQTQASVPTPTAYTQPNLLGNVSLFKFFYFLYFNYLLQRLFIPFIL